MKTELEGKRTMLVLHGARNAKMCTIRYVRDDGEGYAVADDGHEGTFTLSQQTGLRLGGSRG